MTKLLTLCGVEFPLTQADSEPVRAGEVDRAATLAPRSGVRASAEDLKCAVSLLEQPLARAVRGLVEGRGEVLNFESSATPTSYLWGSRGSLPHDMDSGLAVERTTTSRLGTSALALQGDGSDYQGVTYAFPRAAEWTVLGWCNPNYDGYGHWVWCSDGRVYGDGVSAPGSAPNTWQVTVTATATLLKLTDSGGEWGVHDDVVFLPWLLPAEWVPAVYAFHSANPWPSLPYVLAEGAAVPGGRAEVLGEVGTVARTVGASPGTWRESFAFDLRCPP